MVFLWISLQQATALHDFLLAENWCDMAAVETRLVECIQGALTEKSRLVFTFSLLYLFEGKHQYKRLRAAAAREA